jgi:hypothetical protein
MIRHLEGDPYQMGSPLAVLGTAGVRFDALKQCHRLFGALQIDFLEASEHFQAFEHGVALSRFRETSVGLRREAWCNGFKKKSQAGLSEAQNAAQSSGFTAPEI